MGGQKSFSRTDLLLLRLEFNEVVDKLQVILGPNFGVKLEKSRLGKKIFSYIIYSVYIIVTKI